MSSHNDPLVSVILPVKDGERFIAEALESVTGQSATARLQVIVIDDGSTDASLEIVSRACPEAIVLHTPGLGPSGARNAGLTRADGEFIAFIDHDDLWPPGKLAAQLSRMLRDPALDIIIGRTRWVWLPEREAKEFRFPFDDNSVHHVNLGACLMRPRVFERIGLFCEALRYGEDHDLLLRAREAGLMIRVTSDLGLIYRQHRSNMTRGRSMAELNNFEAIRRSLQRRQAAGRLAPMTKMTDQSD